MDNQSIENLTNSAKDLYQGGNYLEAADLFSQAAISYNTKNNHLMSAEMKNNQSVALLLAKEPRKALDACLGTATLFLKQKDNRRAGMAYANEAAALEALKKIGEAEEKIILAADLLKSSGEKDMYAQVFKSLSQIQIRQGRQFEAISSMKTSLKYTENLTLKQKFLKLILKIQKFLLR